MTNNMNSDSPLPCKHLMLSGLPGSGKKTLQTRLCGILETNGAAWSPLSTVRHHTEHGIEQIRNGKLIDDARYWKRFYKRFRDNEWGALNFHGFSTVLSATALTPLLRRQFVDLGRLKADGRTYNDGGRSHNWVVWLKLPSIAVAKKRLRAELAQREDAFFKPEWLDLYKSVTVEPKMRKPTEKSSHLYWSDEENVLVLDASSAMIGWRTTHICNGVPGLKDARQRMHPDDEF